MCPMCRLAELHSADPTTKKQLASAELREKQHDDDDDDDDDGWHQQYDCHRVFTNHRMKCPFTSGVYLFYTSHCTCVIADRLDLSLTTFFILW